MSLLPDSCPSPTVPFCQFLLYQRLQTCRPQAEFSCFVLAVHTHSACSFPAAAHCPGDFLFLKTTLCLHQGPFLVTLPSRACAPILSPAVDTPSAISFFPCLHLQPVSNSPCIAHSLLFILPCPPLLASGTQCPAKTMVLDVRWRRVGLPSVVLGTLPGP